MITKSYSEELDFPHWTILTLGCSEIFEFYNLRFSNHSLSKLYGSKLFRIFCFSVQLFFEMKILHIYYSNIIILGFRDAKNLSYYGTNIF